MYAREEQRPPALSPSETPVTLALIGANVLTFLILFFGSFNGGAGWLVNGLGVTPLSLPFRPWTFLTYALLGSRDLFGLLLSLVLANSICGSLERAWGWRRFLIFFAVVAGVTGLMVWAGMILLSVPSAFMGLMAPLTASVFAWAWINRRERIVMNFYVVNVPMQAMTFAYLMLATLFVFQSIAFRNPILGLLASTGCGLGFWYARDGREWLEDLPIFGGRGGRNAPNKRFVDLGRDIREPKPTRNPLQKMREERDRKERDAKIAEMFRNSGYKDDDRA